MKETLTLTVKLLLITAVVAALLGAVNMVTAPIIEVNGEATFNANLKEVLPEAVNFDLDGTKLPDTESGVTVNGVYCGMLEDGTVVGYVADAVCSEGYGGDVSVMVGVDNEGRITKAKVTDMSETPGLGAKSQTDWIDQYSGLTQNIVVDKNGSAGDNPNKIDAISGATITSKAVTKAVNASLDAAIVVINDNSSAGGLLAADETGVVEAEVVGGEIVEGEIVQGEIVEGEIAESENGDASDGTAADENGTAADENGVDESVESEGGTE